MMNRKKQLLYGIYILAVAVFFLYALFPSDTVATYVTSRLNRVNPDINIDVDRASLAFPLGLRLHDASVYYLSTEVLKTDNLKIVPSFLSLFRSKIVFFFKGSAFEGSLEGRGEFDKSKPDQQAVITVKLTGIQIKDIAAVKHFLGRNITGSLKGTLTYRNSGKLNRELDAELVISDGELEILMPILKQKSIAFSKLDTHITIQNEKVNIKRCTMKSDQLNGSISGIVTLSEPLNQSRLRLSGLIKPMPEFLEKLGKDLPVNLLPKKMLSKKVVRIRIYGSLDQPRFYMN
ncbi:MAG: type II secretion system protein GspN [Desulfobacterales bacterium]